MVNYLENNIDDTEQDYYQDQQAEVMQEEQMQEFYYPQEELAAEEALYEQPQMQQPQMQQPQMQQPQMQQPQMQQQYYPQQMQQQYYPQQMQQMYYPQQMQQMYYPQQRNQFYGQKSSKKTLVIGSLVAALVVVLTLSIALPIALKDDTVYVPDVFQTPNFQENNTYHQQADKTVFMSTMENLMLSDINSSLDDSQKLTGSMMEYDWSHVIWEAEGFYNVGIDVNDPDTNYSISDATVYIDSTEFIDFSKENLSNVIDVNPYVTTDSDDYESFVTDQIKNHYSGLGDDITISFKTDVPSTGQGTLNLSESLNAGGEEMNNQITVTAKSNSEVATGTTTVNIEPKAYDLNDDFIYGDQHYRGNGKLYSTISIVNGHTSDDDNYFFDFDGHDTANDGYINQYIKTSVSDDFGWFSTEQNNPVQNMPQSDSVENLLDFSELPGGGSNSAEKEDEVSEWSMPSDHGEGTSWYYDWTLKTKNGNGILTGRVAMSVFFTITDTN